MSDSKGVFMSQSKNIKRLVLLSMFIGIEIVLMCTPLGFIPIGPIKATTLHIPVLILAMVLGVKEGMILGLFFGISSIITNTLQPAMFSFCFSPFYSIGDISGNLGSIVIAVFPRLMLAIFCGGLYKQLSKQIKHELAIGISSAVGSLVHTFMVILLIYHFFGREYAHVAGFAYETFLNVIKMTILTNGMTEAILAVIISISIMKVFKVKGVHYE